MFPLDCEPFVCEIDHGSTDADGAGIETEDRKAQPHSRETSAPAVVITATGRETSVAGDGGAGSAFSKGRASAVATPGAANVLAGLAACVENVSAAARSLSSVAFAAEVAEKIRRGVPLFDLQNGRTHLCLHNAHRCA